MAIHINEETVTVVLKHMSMDLSTALIKAKITHNFELMNSLIVMLLNTFSTCTPYIANSQHSLYYHFRATVNGKLFSALLHA